VPILVYSKNVRKDNLKKFSERDCGKGGLGTIMGKDVMKNLRKILRF
jgi:2,3-bisphosphoglycerate-independent phosphoglycerate mutase